MAEQTPVRTKRTLSLSHRIAISNAKGGNTPIIDKVMDKVEKTDTCWLWTGNTDKDGYGLFSTFIMGKAYTERTHSIVYKHHKGAVSKGLVLDHLCRKRHCVNPEHLEPVTILENVRRGFQATKTHCVNGHEFTPENTKRNPSGTRKCFACQKDYSRASRLRKKELQNV